MSRKSIVIIICFMVIKSTLLSQIDQSNPFYKNFNLEMNVGFGYYRSSDYIAPPAPDSENNLPGSTVEGYRDHSTFNTAFSFNYRNSRFKLGIGSEFFIYSTRMVHDLNFNLALNILRKKRRPNTFLGPYFSAFPAIEQYTNYYQFQLGVDYYYKQFHVGYRNSTISYKISTWFPNHLNYILVGYAFKIDKK